MSSSKNGNGEGLNSDWVACWALRRSGMNAEQIGEQFGVGERIIQKRIKYVQESLNNIITPTEMRSTLALIFPQALQAFRDLIDQRDPATVNNYFNKLAFNDAGDGQRPGLSILLAVLSDKLNSLSLEDLKQLAKTTEAKQTQGAEIEEIEPQEDVKAKQGEPEPSVEVNRDSE